MEADTVLKDDVELDGQDHSKLLSNAQKTLGSKAKLSLGARTEHCAVSGSHEVASAGKISLENLIGGDKRSVRTTERRKELKRDTLHQGQAVLQPELHKHVQSKLNRQAAYEKARKEMNRWNPIVQSNRKAEQLVFAKEAVSMKPPSIAGWLKNNKLRTPMELEIASILKNSPSVHECDKKSLAGPPHKSGGPRLTKQEESDVKAMSLKEALALKAELQRLKARQSYMEARARRQNKIKSKRYHRALRKGRLKSEQAELARLEKSDPAALAEKLEALEQERLKERISLKHRGGSKFAKKQMIFAKYDEKGRQQVADMLQLSRELTRHQRVDPESESPTESSESEVEEESKGTENPWMVQERKRAGRVAETFITRDAVGYKRPPEVRAFQQAEESDEEETSAEVIHPQPVVQETVFNIDGATSTSDSPVAPLQKSVIVDKIVDSESDIEQPHNSGKYVLKSTSHDESASETKAKRKATLKTRAIQSSSSGTELSQKIPHQVLEGRLLLEAKSNCKEKALSRNKVKQKQCVDGSIEKSLGKKKGKDKSKRTPKKKTSTKNKDHIEAELLGEKSSIYESQAIDDAITEMKKTGEESSIYESQAIDANIDVEKQSKQSSTWEAQAIDDASGESGDEVDDIFNEVAMSKQHEQRKRKLSVDQSKNKDVKQLTERRKKRKTSESVRPGNEDVSVTSESTRRVKVLSELDELGNEALEEEYTLHTAARKLDDEALKPEKVAKTKDLGTTDMARIMADGRRVKNDTVAVTAEDSDNEKDVQASVKMTLAEAFADDDVIAEFKEEKKSVEERDQPAEDSGYVAGWGSWAGTGLKQPRKKFLNRSERGGNKKRQEKTRKDANLDHVIINEKAEKAVRKHQVKDVPFPFTTLADYEASLRQPLGRDWLPETAHRNSTRSRVVTKNGAIIQPMDKTAAFSRKRSSIGSQRRSANKL